MTRIKKTSITFLSLIALLFISLSDVQASNEPVWYEIDANDQPIIHLYFFWSEKCPHCLQARPDIIQMAKELSWLKLHSLELMHNPKNVETFFSMSAMFDGDAKSVPTFMFCGNSLSGYDDKGNMGQWLRGYLQACYQFAEKNRPENSTAYVLDSNELTSVDIPVLGKVTSGDYSLPVLTLFIAGMDAFNPCAFFVLLFLLSMMVHARSRS